MGMLLYCFTLLCGFIEQGYIDTKLYCDPYICIFVKTELRGYMTRRIQFVIGPQNAMKC